MIRRFRKLGVVLLFFVPRTQDLCTPAIHEGFQMTSQRPKKLHDLRKEKHAEIVDQMIHAFNEKTKLKTAYIIVPLGFNEKIPRFLVKSSKTLVESKK